MRAVQKSISNEFDLRSMDIGFNPNLILVFISPGYNDKQKLVDVISQKYPDAIITGCSTSGEISNTTVDDDTAIINALSFEKTTLKLAAVHIDKVDNSYQAGIELINSLASSKLNHVLVFSDGLHVNGDELVSGLTSKYKSELGITGGFAGDGPDFNNTFVIKNGEILDNTIIAIGLYGNNLNVSYSSRGGWDSFGIERLITKSEGTELFEIDGLPALELYKSFLGEKAKELPGSGLLFPLSLRKNEDEQPLVRTILSINEENQSLVFAGNVPQGSYIRLMKANIDRLINGAEESAKLTKAQQVQDPDFAMLVSCVGRRLVLKQLVEEEVEAVREVLGEKPVMTGFYSYGEMAPFGKGDVCKLHNQTMTITTFSERA